MHIEEKTMATNLAKTSGLLLLFMLGIILLSNVLV
jgi:hypothetical protein